MASGHALISSIPSSSSSSSSSSISQGQEVKLDILQMDSQGVVNVAIQSSSTWGVDNSNTNSGGMVGSSNTPRVDSITDLYIMNMMQSKASVSLLLSSDRGHFNHLIDVYSPGVYSFFSSPDSLGNSLLSSSTID